MLVIFYSHTQLYGDSGRLQREPFRQILNRFLKLPTQKMDQLFNSLDKTKSGFIVFEDFRLATENDVRFKRLYAPNRNFRQKWISNLINNLFSFERPETHQTIWNITNFISFTLDQIIMKRNVFSNYPKYIFLRKFLYKLKEVRFRIVIVSSKLMFMFQKD